jgi:metal-responsive CopG/Arc/MetJ family transcriptional regulator
MKNTITIPDELVNAIDQIVGHKNNIEQLIELLLRKYIEEERRKRQDLQDLQILNENSEYLNSEAEDVLTYQVNL